MKWILKAKYKVVGKSQVIEAKELEKPIKAKGNQGKSSAKTTEIQAKSPGPKANG